MRILVRCNGEDSCIYESKDIGLMKIKVYFRF